MMSATSYLFALVFGPFVLTTLVLFRGGPMMNPDAAAQDLKEVQVGQDFPIKIGKQTKVEGEDLQIRFIAVSEDSRCPADVNCIWAGNAAVMLDLIQNKCTTRLTLNTHQNSQAAEEGKSGHYRVKLVKLDPYPRTDRKIAAGDYTATLLVSKE